MATMAQAKREFELGMHRGFRIDRINQLNYVVLLYSTIATPNTKHSETLDDARTRQPRAFKTLDAAVRSLEMIGFKVDHVGS